MMFPRGFTLVERRTLKRHLTCSYVESLILWRNVDTVQFAPDLRLICAWLRPVPSGVFLRMGVQFAPGAAQGTPTQRKLDILLRPAWACKPLRVILRAVSLSHGRLIVCL
jgi:hypothetical protein